MSRKRSLCIMADSHLDHGLFSDHLKFMLESFRDFGSDTDIEIRTLQLPESIEPLDSALYGPAAGDDPIDEAKVFYQHRSGRNYPSRMSGAKSRSTRMLTVIMGPHGGHDCILYTAFGGPSTPKEPGDPMLADEDREASVAFWQEHALALDR